MRLGKLNISKRFLALGLGIGMPVMLAGAFAIPSLASAQSNASSASELVTFYGWFDNSPPGNGVSGPACGAGHGDVAGGVGSTADPRTYADPQNLNTYCQQKYIPALKINVVHQDQCNPCGGQNSNHIDVWIGGNANSNKTALLSCENDWTSNYPVQSGTGAADTSPFFTNPGTCAATHGGTAQPNPGSGAGGASGEGGSFSSGSGGGGSGSGGGASGSGGGASGSGGGASGSGSGSGSGS